MKEKKLMKLLEKRAKGFSYEEVSEEYVVGEKCKISDDESAENASKEPVLAKNDDVALFCDADACVVELPQKRKRGRPRKSEVEARKKAAHGESLVLSKRKITRHYVEPDMTAIKILIELGRGKVQEKISPEELAEKRKVLLEQIRKELDELEK